MSGCYKMNIFVLVFLYLTESHVAFGNRLRDSCPTGSLGLVTMSPEFLTTSLTSLPTSNTNACNLSTGSCNSPPMACNSTCCLPGSNSKTQACGCLPDNQIGKCADPKQLHVFVEFCPVDSAEIQHQINVEVAEVLSTTPCVTTTNKTSIITDDGRVKTWYRTIHCIRQQGSPPELTGMPLERKVVQTIVINSGFYYMDNFDCTFKPTKTL